MQESSAPTRIYYEIYIFTTKERNLDLNSN